MPFASLIAAMLLAFAPSTQHLRIVTLVPSFAEDVCVVGAARSLVGVSAYSNDVPCAKGLPVAGDFSSVDAEKIIALRANLVLGIPAQARLAQPLTNAGIRVVLLGDDSYQSIFTNISRIGALTGRSSQAQAVIARLHHETRTLQARVRTGARRPRVFVVLGTGPIFTAGPSSYIATLLTLAGARNAVVSLPTAYSAYSAEALLRLQPDAIVSDAPVQLPSVLSREPWRSLRAVQQHHVFIISNASLLERPGPHYNEGLRWLIEQLAPLR